MHGIDRRLNSARWMKRKIPSDGNGCREIFLTAVIGDLNDCRVMPVKRDIIIEMAKERKNRINSFFRKRGSIVTEWREIMEAGCVAVEWKKGKSILIEIARQSLLRKQGRVATCASEAG